MALPLHLLLHHHKLSHASNQTVANQNCLNQATMFPHLPARIISLVNNVVAIGAATAVEIVAASVVVVVTAVAVAVAAIGAEIAGATVVASAVVAAVMAAAPVVDTAVIVATVAALIVVATAAETEAGIAVVAEAATTRARVMANHHLVRITINRQAVAGLFGTPNDPDATLTSGSC